MLTDEHGKPRRQRHFFRLRVIDQRPHQVFPCPQHGQDRQCGQAGFHQRQQYIPIGAEIAAPIDPGRFIQFTRQRGKKLPHEKHAKHVEQPRQHQTRHGIGQSQLHHHLEPGNNKDLAGYHHQRQHTEKQHILTRKI